MEMQCAICSATVIRYPSTIKDAVYCSMACVGISKRRGQSFECAKCGSSFYRRPAEQDARNLYCSRDCYMADRDHNKSYKKIGERHLHRIVAEKKLGRKLRPKEVVHHIDGNKRNNSPRNLAVLKNQSEHAKIHFQNENLR